MNNEELLKNLRNVPDFPHKGIMFYDVTTLFKNAEAMGEIADRMYDLYKDKGITKVVGIESRGFIMATVLASRLKVGFVPIRKPGKLPAETIEESYDKEYGRDTIQMHKDAIDANDIVLIHDDLLATGGTTKAACDLVKQINPRKIMLNFIIEMPELKGREAFDKGIDVTALLQVSGK